MSSVSDKSKKSSWPLEHQDRKDFLPVPPENDNILTTGDNNLEKGNKLDVQVNDRPNLYEASSSTESQFISE